MSREGEQIPCPVEARPSFTPPLSFDPLRLPWGTLGSVSGMPAGRLSGQAPSRTLERPRDLGEPSRAPAHGLGHGPRGASASQGATQELGFCQYPSRLPPKG
eukprot:6944136-Pyramimonas_sp.AAC.2